MERPASSSTVLFEQRNNINIVGSDWTAFVIYLNKNTNLKSYRIYTVVLDMK